MPLSSVAGPWHSCETCGRFYCPACATCSLEPPPCLASRPASARLEHQRWPTLPNIQSVALKWLRFLSLTSDMTGPLRVNSLSFQLVQKTPVTSWSLHPFSNSFNPSTSQGISRSSRSVEFLAGTGAHRLASIGAESLRCEPLATATRVFGGAFGRGALWARDSVAIANLTSE